MLLRNFCLILITIMNDLRERSGKNRKIFQYVNRMIHPIESLINKWKRV
jgi:hypothetical protein